MKAQHIAAKYRAGAFLQPALSSSSSSSTAAALDAALLRAVALNDIGGVFRLLVHGADPNAGGGGGGGPLGLAAMLGHRCVAAVLLLGGAAPAARDAAHRTPGGLARAHGFLDLAAELAAADHELLTALGHFVG